MPDHDQHFKQLLQTCFGDLVSPIHSSTPLRHFTPRPGPLHPRRPRAVLVHVEVEAQARRRMGLRLFEYAMQLWLRHRRPIVPIVVYLRGGQPDVTRQTERIKVFGRILMTFRYLAFGLSPSQAADYLKRPEPLAWALAALMRHRGLSPAQHRLACLRPAAAAKIDDARKFLLLNFVETYVQLDDSEQEEYETLLRDERNREVAIMAELTLTTNADRLAHKHYVEGLEKGREQGQREGREHGQRELLLHLLTRRFGPLTEATRQRVQALTSSEELSRLAERVLDARSLDDLGL